MSTIIAVLAAAAMSWPSATYQGLATYYGEGLMEQVYEYRVSIGQVARCPDCVGLAALNEKRHIGRRIWVEHGGLIYGPLLVVDCAEQSRDLAVRRAQGRVLEVDRKLARAWGMTAPVPVRVFFFNPLPQIIMAGWPYPI